jgi:energy-coupling factor transport system permease protein
MIAVGFPVLIAMHFHPASLIFLWFSFLLAFSVRSDLVLMLGCFVVMVWAYLSAPLQLQHLLRRSRWLVLTVVMIFLWMTPGVPLSFIPYATQEGLHLAVMQSTRVLLTIASLALVLQYLSCTDLVAGIYFFLSPLRWIGVPAKKIAVRLMLTLEEVERASMFRPLTNESRQAQLVNALSLPKYGWRCWDAGIALISVLLVFSTGLP